MIDIQSVDPPPTELAAYRGEGVRGWRIEIGEGRQTVECVHIDAGKAFGGEWPEPQEWQILEGSGFLSWEPRPARVRVSAGHRYRFDAGERRLLRAETPIRSLISPLP